MDRKRSHRSLNQGAMRPDRIAESELLLSSCAGRCRQSCADEAHRRDLHRKALPWLQSHYPKIEEGRLCCQSQTNSEVDAKNGVGWNATWTQHVKKSPRTLEISLPVEGPLNFKPIAGVEHRYNVHSAARRIYLSHSRDRLVQSISFSLSPFKQSGKHILHRGCRGSNREIRATGDFQYRPGCPIFFQPICRRHIGPRNSLQHGWAWTCSGQCFCRAPMEVCKI